MGNSNKTRRPDSLFLEADNMARRRGQRKGYVFRKGPSWFVQYRVDTAEVDASGKFKRLKDAAYVAPATGPGKVTKKQAERIAWEEYLCRLDQMSTRPQSMKTVREFVRERFEPDVVWSCKPSGKAHYGYILKNHVLPVLGEIRLRDMRPAHVQDLVRAKLESGLSIQTVVHIRNAVSAVFRHAKRLQAYSGDLPTEGVRLPELVHAQKRALTWEQVKLLAQVIGRMEPKPLKKHGQRMRTAEDMEAANLKLGVLVTVLAITGLRIGEAMGLRWRRVNLDDTHVLVDGRLLKPYSLLVCENYVRGRYGTVKSKNSYREVPLSTEAWYQLARLKAAAQFTGPDDPVFSSGAGRPLDQHNVAARFLRPAAQRVGCPWVSWHVLRHTASTLADQAGLSVAELQRVLGHSTAEMTLHYTHAEIERVRERLEKIGDPGKVN